MAEVGHGQVAEQEFEENKANKALRAMHDFAGATLIQPSVHDPGPLAGTLPCCCSIPLVQPSFEISLDGRGLGQWPVSPVACTQACCSIRALVVPDETVAACFSDHACRIMQRCMLRS